MESDRSEKMAEVIKRGAAEFFERESNRDALVSVTNVMVTPDSKRAMIYISVLPESKENGVLDFAKRKRGELREYLFKHVRSRSLPFLDVSIDFGEKNRQHLDSILR
jgi:ribosome-binding factor A